MADLESLDISLFGPWPVRPRYDGGASIGRSDIAFHEIEPKARRGETGDDLRLLLNDLTAEMRAQFSFFRKLRMAAVKKGRAGEDGPDIRTEVKAAADELILLLKQIADADFPLVGSRRGHVSKERGNH